MAGKQRLWTAILTEDGRLLERVRAIELRNGVVHETGKWKTIDRNFEGVFNVYRTISSQLLSDDDEWFEYEIVMIDGEVKQVRRK